MNQNYKQRQMHQYHSLMGRQRRPSTHHQTPTHKPHSSPFVCSLTTSHLTRCTRSSLRANFRKILLKLMEGSSSKKSLCLVSFLNVILPDEPTSINQIGDPNHIPSIQNMMSQKQIQCELPDSSGYGSVFSFQEATSARVIRDCPSDLAIPYLCLLQKILKKLRCRITGKQTKKVMQATWNILAKYWKDHGYSIYQVGEKVQWGLLELINFDFSTSKRQRYEAEEKVRNYKEKQVNIQPVPCKVEESKEILLNM